MRPTPFSYVFGEIAEREFPPVAAALERTGGIEADRDQFVLLEPVGRLLREIVPDDASADALEAHVRLLHHAFCHWVAQGWVYRIGEAALSRAISEKRITARLPRPAIYLQLPELRVWGTPHTEGPAEPLDGMFVTESLPEGLAVLAIFGMRPDRPGFSAVGLDGRADADDAGANEIELAAVRDDGSRWGSMAAQTLMTQARTRSNLPPSGMMGVRRLGRCSPAGRLPGCTRSRMRVNCCCSPPGY